MNDEELEAKVAELLAGFYKRRLGKLREITLATICKKNPYLFRATGVNKPYEIVESVLQAFLSSSEETVFGNIFFEPLALAASQVKGGYPSGAAGVDIEYTSELTNTAIALKSSTMLKMPARRASKIPSSCSYGADCKKQARTLTPSLHPVMDAQQAHRRTKSTGALRDRRFGKS